MNCLCVADLTEIKSMNNPPEAVKTVVKALAVLLNGVATQDWATAKKLMGEKDLMHRLMSYDKNNISENTIRALQSYTCKDDFKPEIVK